VNEKLFRAVALAKAAAVTFCTNRTISKFESRSFPRRDGFSSRPPELRLLELEVSNDHLHLVSVGRPSMGSKLRQTVPIRIVEIA